ncbi:MAG: type II/IV secretion system ATPase subunit [Candidatus Aenigmatarchaeota archaeon]
MTFKKFFVRLVRGYKNISQKKKEEIPIKVEEVKITTEEISPIGGKVKAEEEIKIEGIEIPEFPSKVKIGAIKPEEEVKLKISYPLIPRNPAKNEPIFAYARIYWDEELDRYRYEVVEPEFTEKLRNIIERVKDLLEQKLDVDFSKLKIFEAKEYLKRNVDEILKYYGFKLTEEEKKILNYYVDRDFIGLGKIEPLMQDPNIEDISCDGVGIPIFVFHRDPKFASLATNIQFDSSEELDSFVIRLSQLCGKAISVATPLVEGSLRDGSRVQATLATDIARRGSSFTIRKFTEEPLTPIHLLSYNTLDPKILAYLWFAVDYGKSVLISGGTATGKTSLLNVLSLFIRPEKKIVSIEDTPELRLPHSHWVPTVARVPMVLEERKGGEVDLFDLLKESLRMRPDYIIVGEVRGKEAFVLFQEMATGHASMATIHAENLPKLVDRLTTPPISLPPGLVASLDIVVFLSVVRHKERPIRKVVEVVEVVGIEKETNRPIVNRVFKWNPIGDKFEITGKSVVLKKISESTGIRENQIKEEIERRMLLLNWMKENNIIEYKQVFKVLNAYYNYPERIISAIGGA